jgi:hypothetical protein
MNSEDEMMMEQLLQDGVDAQADDEERITIFRCLLCL